jgi:EAL domain-containing protein (putative c-di-GMP-specific phosphodiesterase class I)
MYLTAILVDAKLAANSNVPENAAGNLPEEVRGE